MVARSLWYRVACAGVGAVGAGIAVFQVVERKKKALTEEGHTTTRPKSLQRLVLCDNEMATAIHKQVGILLA